VSGPDAPPAPASSDRPEWLPEKFVKDGKPDYEALAKSYVELEKARSGQQQQQKDPNAQPDPNAPDPNGDAARKAVEGAGLKFEEFTAEWSEKGELSAESYEKLAKGGIPKDLVDSYIAGQKALIDSMTSRLTAAAHEAAGGKDAYDSAVSWAAKNMSKGEKEAFNAILDSGDADKIKMAVSGLVARAKSAGAVEPKNLSGQTSGGEPGYQSLAEMIRDMQDPKYASDPAFRLKVERKLAVSKNI
jgi:hypothetical protein